MSEQSWRGQKLAPNAPEAKATPSKDDLVEVPLTMMVGGEKRVVGRALVARFCPDAVAVKVTDPVLQSYFKTNVLDGLSISPNFKDRTVDIGREDSKY